ncbi:ATP-dependent DNA helicase pfh1 [Colletotrichum fructicola]|nr:ATP-dependent DNA helicase pfh1 [Colletotrichum fructicola]
MPRPAPPLSQLDPSSRRRGGQSKRLLWGNNRCRPCEGARPSHKTVCEPLFIATWAVGLSLVPTFMPGPSWLSVDAAPPSRTVRVRCRQQGHPQLTVRMAALGLPPASGTPLVKHHLRPLPLRVPGATLRCAPAARIAQYRAARVAPGQAAGMPKVPSTLTGAARRVVPRRLTGRPPPVFSASTRRPPRSRSSTHINDPPRSACRQHLALGTFADPSTKSRPEPATRRQRRPPPAVHTNVPVHAPTNTMATSQNEGAGSGGWHESLQIRDKRSSSADPESLILAEVERLMAEYTRGIDRNLPSKSKGKTYYVVWKGIKCGIFTSWPQCKLQTSGFSGAQFKGTRTFQEAEGILRVELTKEVSRSHPRSIAETGDVPRALASSPALPHRDNPHRDRPAIIRSHPHPRPELETAAVDGPTDDGGDGPEAADAQGQERQPLHIPGDPPLCPEQQNAIDLAMQGDNLFITGSGGCGKSVVVRALHRTLAARYQDTGQAVHLLAPTGQASINIGGRTTYNYAGWTPEDAKKPLDGHGSVIKKARGQRIFNRYCNTAVVIIDEISMVENQFFERLSYVMSAIRDDPEPFGGVQIIVVGDFCQLPPVKPFGYCLHCGREMKKLNDQWTCPDGHGDAFEDRDKWAFKALEWKRCNFNISMMPTQTFSSPTTPKLRKAENGTELKSTREQVDQRNLGEFVKIPGHVHEYKAADACTLARGETRQPLDRLHEHRYPRELQLKVDTPVILLANVDLDSGLCNGRQGVVIGFVPSDTIQEPRPPLLQNYQDDYDGYRAATERHKRIVDYLRSAWSNKDMFPKVRFANGEKKVIGPDCAVIGYGDQSPYSYLSRTQIPLTQGWAMTIHKSQSLSLDRVVVDLSRMFEHGQAYVALSRARNLSGLRVIGADAYSLRRIFQVDDAVRAFMRSIDSNDMEDQPEDARAAGSRPFE